MNPMAVRSGHINPVLILTHNCLELTRRCVESVRNQDIDTYIHIFDNNSTDGTREWMEQRWCRPDYQFTWNYGHDASSKPTNMGVSFGWNFNLMQFFGGNQFELDSVLVLNNDTVIPSHFLRTLLSCDVPFVTGVSFGDMDEVMKPPTVSLTDGPDFSAFLIRRDCWEKVGLFDESMKNYCSDVDYDIRARKAGITLYNSHCKFYHERSSTLRLSPDRAEIQEQSQKDHEAFRAKYGCLPAELGWWGSQNNG